MAVVKDGDLREDCFPKVVTTDDEHSLASEPREMWHVYLSQSDGALARLSMLEPSPEERRDMDEARVEEGVQRLLDTVDALTREWPDKRVREEESADPPLSSLLKHDTVHSSVRDFC